MAVDLFEPRTLVMLINSLVTMGFSPFLIRLYLKNRKNFYLLWGVGFLLYGLNILTRMLTPPATIDTLNPLHWLSYIFYSFGFSNLITGIGDLINKAKLAFISSLSIFLLPILIYYLPENLVPAWVVTLLPYFLICTYLAFIRQRYHASVDMLIIGFTLLLTINMAIPFGSIEANYIDILAIYGKIIIYYGMISPRFTFLADDMKQFLISGEAQEYANGVIDHTILVHPSVDSRGEEIEWLYDMIHENTRKGVRTILVSFYDLISLNELRARGVSEEEVYLVRMLPRGEKDGNSVEESVATLEDDLYQLEILITEIINFSKERRIRCNIILYTLSWAIHTHNINKVYSFLTSQIPALKASNVQMHGIYYPETHPQEDVLILEKLVDKIIDI